MITNLVITIAFFNFFSSYMCSQSFHNFIGHNFIGQTLTKCKNFCNFTYQCRSYKNNEMESNSPQKLFFFFHGNMYLKFLTSINNLNTFKSIPMIIFEKFTSNFKVAFINENEIKTKKSLSVVIG